MTTLNSDAERRSVKAPVGCDCHSRRTPRFVVPSLLLLLKGKPGYGYELMQRLGELGLFDGPADPAAVYRTLRKLESNKLVRSAWDTKNTGPARRCYRITAAGQKSLKAWKAVIAERKMKLEQLLKMFDEK
ncbi:MAG: helix-turn-helix transcriptional regulator [bacterium]|nr:helix-turn-helix transcriptional regulator [bacterium]